MNKVEIENAAHELRKLLWLKRAELGFIDGLNHPQMLLDPEVAARVLGIEYDFYEELGRFGNRDAKFEVAGTIDRNARKICISKKFSSAVMRFTGAHEIGHWLLHPNEVMHRDKPIKGLIVEANQRSRTEWEADYFAACFLMPPKLVRAAIQKTFRTNVPIEFNENTAFWLSPQDPDLLLRPQGDLDRALAVASVETYQGEHFHSLAKQFNVSVMSMAIRLKELEWV